MPFINRTKTVSWVTEGISGVGGVEINTMSDGNRFAKGSVG